MHMLPPKKRFGQHFLKDQNVISHIIQAIDPKQEDILVEIGPGHGALTHPMLNRIKHLHVVEFDRDLCHHLRQIPQLTVHEHDALKFDFSALAKNGKLLRIFGNLPYNISTPLLFHLLTFNQHIQDMVFMLQKEVVDRITAVSDQAAYGRLSVMIQYHCLPQSLFDVEPDAFIPPPKVRSSILRLVPQEPSIKADDYKLFSLVVNTAFQYRRKTLSNALKKLVNDPLIYQQAQIDPRRRPETLSMNEFVLLSNVIGAFLI